MCKLSPKELAAKLNVHPNTVYNWIHFRKLHVHRILIHSPIVIDWDEFQKWSMSHK